MRTTEELERAAYVAGDGYDKGGAYWGTPSNVWGVWGWIDGRPCCAYTGPVPALTHWTRYVRGQCDNRPSNCSRGSCCYFDP
jgi:hypothetical protein